VFARKKDLLKAIDDIIEDSEEIKKVKISQG